MKKIITRGRASGFWTQKTSGALLGSAVAALLLIAALSADGYRPAPSGAVPVASAHH